MEECGGSHRNTRGTWDTHPQQGCLLSLLVVQVLVHIEKRVEEYMGELAALQVRQRDLPCRVGGQWGDGSGRVGLWCFRGRKVGLWNHGGRRVGPRSDRGRGSGAVEVMGFMTGFHGKVGGSSPVGGLATQHESESCRGISPCGKPPTRILLTQDHTDT